MATNHRASWHQKGSGRIFIFLALLYLFGTGQHPSWGQESVLDHGPSPDSVRALNSPLDLSFSAASPAPMGLHTAEGQAPGKP